jgi:hypothetical protein
LSLLAGLLLSATALLAATLPGLLLRLAGLLSATTLLAALAALLAALATLLAALATLLAGFVVRVHNCSLVWLVSVQLHFAAQTSVCEDSKWNLNGRNQF